MRRIEHIEQQIRELSAGEFSELRVWIAGQDRGQRNAQAEVRPRPRSLGIGDSGQQDTARRTSDERPEPRPLR